MQGVEAEMADTSAQPGVEISQQAHTSVEMVESSAMIESTSDVLSAVPLEGDLTGSEVQDDLSKTRRAGIAVLPDSEPSEQDPLKIKGPDDASAQSTAQPAEGVIVAVEAAQTADGQQVLLEGVPVGAPGELQNGVYGFITPDGYAVPFFPGGAVPMQAGRQVENIFSHEYSSFASFHKCGLTSFSKIIFSSSSSNAV